MKKTISHKAPLIGMLLMSVAVTSACGKKTVNDLPPVADGSGDFGNGNGGNNGGSGQGTVVPGSQQDFAASVSADRIFFDTDRFNIDPEDQIALQSQAQWMARYPQAQATIEGHADERGTRDYNLALGERRANAAKNYLASLGVNPARLRTVSYGKEQPQALGSDEQSWAQNRRAVTIIIE